MRNFIAIKIHYDHRSSLPHYLKYTRAPNAKEYQEYLDLFSDEGVGGNGFHECLNFRKGEDGACKIYLPPGYIPHQKKCDEEFVIFTFTYSSDQELPAHIIGVHANATIVSREGIERKDVPSITGYENFFYHAECRADLATIFNVPIKYDFKDGRHTPHYQMWGNGMRYLSEEHARTILADAMKHAKDRLCSAKNAERISLESEIQVLESIEERYFGRKRSASFEMPSKGRVSPPDKEIGFLGERYVYELEVERARKAKIDPAKVEWISQSVPTSPFDIKTVRFDGATWVDHYIEVKSTKLDDYSNVFISDNQINFFDSHPNVTSFVFVNFDSLREVKSIRNFTIDEIRRFFDLAPVKYRIVERQVNVLSDPNGSPADAEKYRP